MHTAGSASAWPSAVISSSCRAAGFVAESEGFGKGATFRVELPVRSVYALDAVEERAHPQAPVAAAAIVVPRLEGVRILAVDDDRDALALVREILEATGATVTTAHSGQAALDKVALGAVDVLVADLGMPGMNGFDLIAAIRAIERCAGSSDIPAAALTAFARSDDRTRALRSGFQLHLAKPIEPGELMAATATLARQVHARE